MREPLGRGAPRGLPPPMASLARVRARGHLGHRHLTPGALHVVVLELAATASVTPTARAQAGARRRATSATGSPPARRLARLCGASIPPPRERGARPRDQTLSRAAQAAVRRCATPRPFATALPHNAMPRRPRDDNSPCRHVSAPRHLAQRPPREAPSPSPMLSLSPSRLRRPDNDPRLQQRRSRRRTSPAESRSYPAFDGPDVFRASTEGVDGFVGTTTCR